MESDNVFKIAAAYTRVRDYLAANSWEFRGVDEGMDTFRNRETGSQVWIEDISEDFPVTFLMGELGLSEFREMAHEMAPKITLLEVESSWEGKPTTIVVAMTQEQVREMFGRRTKMKPVPARRVAQQV